MSYFQTFRVDYRTYIMHIGQGLYLFDRSLYKKDYLVFHDTRLYWFNSLRPRRNRRHFADDIFRCIFLNENVLISIKISLKFIPKGPINNIPALVQVMAWRRPGDKPLSEPIVVSLLTHICVTRPQWVKVCSTTRRQYHKKAFCPKRTVGTLWTLT